VRQLATSLVILMLGGAGAAAAAELPELRAALASPQPEARARAAWQLAGLREVPGDVRQALRTAVASDSAESVRTGAAWALGHLGPDTPLFDEPPRPILVRGPRYPRWAFQSRIEGTVLVGILIDEHGRVAHAEVRHSIPALDLAAVRCVKAWSFEPALHNGRPVASYAEAPVTFTIQ
jgi:TonB family protein